MLVNGLPPKTRLPSKQTSSDILIHLQAHLEATLLSCQAHQLQPLGSRVRVLAALLAPIPVFARTLCG